jgi:probable rRNA maturation factor
MKSIKINLQIATKNKSIPHKKDFINWLAVATNTVQLPKNKNEINIRLIDELESATLNKNYRNIDKPTNILSFAYQPDINDDNLLGDLAICAPIVEQEAQQQQKSSLAHWAHIVIHGYLHLLGFEHQNAEEAKKMEQLEIEILRKLRYPSPY